MVQQLQSMVREWWGDLKEDKYALAFMGALFVALLGMGGWKAKSWYVQRQEGAAQVRFSEALDEYDRVLYSIKKGAEEKQGWDDALFAFKTVEQNHSGTTYAVYAQAFQADIEARQGHYDAALTLLGQAVNQLGKKSPAYYLFETKKALLTLDAGKVDEALESLEALANDQNNPNNDTATYFLGAYYWSQDKFEQAKKAWAPLDASHQPTDLAKVSPWSQVVQVKLSQIA